MVLAFGSLDPSSGATVNATVAAATLQADEAGDCRNVTLSISADNGQNFSGGSRRLSNGTDFIAYTLALPVSYAAPGNNRWLTYSFSGSITGTAYQNASAGSYSDTVVLSVSP
jgi:spore coat protein U-like protein